MQIPLNSYVSLTLTDNGQVSGFAVETTEQTVTLKDGLVTKIIQVQDIVVWEPTSPGASRKLDPEALRVDFDQHVKTYAERVSASRTINVIGKNHAYLAFFYESLLQSDAQRVFGSQSGGTPVNDKNEHRQSTDRLLKYIQSSANSQLKHAEKNRLMGLVNLARGEYIRSSQYFAQAVLAEDLPINWLNLAAASLQNKYNEPLACYCLNKYFSQTPISADVESWLVFVRLFNEYAEFGLITALLNNPAKNHDAFSELIDATIFSFEKKEQGQKAIRIFGLRGDINAATLSNFWADISSAPVTYYTRFVQCIDHLYHSKVFISEPQNATGWIYEYIADRRYGFVIGQDWGNHFFHYSAMKNDVKLFSDVQAFDWRFATNAVSDLIAVTFSTEFNGRALQATNMRRISDRNEPARDRAASEPSAIASAFRNSGIGIGRIKSYQPTVRKGVVVGDNNTDFSFHISDSHISDWVKDLRPGIRVEFRVFNLIDHAQVIDAKAKYSLPSRGLIKGRVIWMNGSNAKVVGEDGKEYRLTERTKLNSAVKSKDTIYFHANSIAKITALLPDQIPESKDVTALDTSAINRDFRDKPEDSDPMTPQVERIFLDAIIAREKGDFAFAQSGFEKALRLQSHADLYVAYAKMQESNDLEHAIELYKQGIEKFPHEGVLYQNLASVLRNKHRLSDAAGVLRAGLSKLEDGSYAVNLYAALLSVLADIGTESSLREALSQGRKALEKGIKEERIPHKLRLLLVSSSAGSPNSDNTTNLYEKVIPFFSAGGFRYNVRDITKEYADITLMARDDIYVETYDLKHLLVRCFFKNPIMIGDIRGVTKALGRYQRDGEAGDVGIVVMQNVAQWRDHLYNMLTQSPEAIIPVEADLFQRTGQETASQALRQLLDQWLAKRDRFQENSAVSGRRFYGRERQLQDLMLNIQDGQHTGIYGLRKVGKTSLLKQLKQKMPQDIVCFIELESLCFNADCRFLFEAIGSEIRRELEEKAANIGLNYDSVRLQLGGESMPPLETLSLEQVAGQFAKDIDYLIDCICRQGLDTKIVITIDETELMLPFFEGHTGFPGYDKFFSYIRGLSQRTDGRVVSVIAAANPLINEVPSMAGKDNPVFQMYKPMYLPPFARQECFEMVEKLAKGMLVQFETQALQMIYEETGGHPYITREFCSYILKVKPERPVTVSLADIGDRVPAFVREKGKVFEEIMRRLADYFPHEKDLLEFVAIGASTESELQGLAGEAVDMDMALRHLLGYQLIEEIDGKYHIKIRLLNRWLKKNNSI